MIVALIAFAIVAAAAGGAWFAHHAASAPINELARALESVHEKGNEPRLVPEHYGRHSRVVAHQINGLLDARKRADDLARDAGERARQGEQRGEQIARELDPALAAVGERTEELRAAIVDPNIRATLDLLGRDLYRAADLVRGILAMAESAQNPEARADLCHAVRRVMRMLLERGLARGASVTLDLDERACTVPGTLEALDRLAIALIGTAIADGGETPLIGVYVRRMPRVQLEEGQVRRGSDPALTIVPRRPNPRLLKWLSVARPPAEVVKLIVAGSGHGIPADVERRFFDPKAERDGANVGLAIARRVIEQSGGTVWIQRAREGGAAFHVVLPMAGVDGPPPDTRNEMMQLASVS